MDEAEDDVVHRPPPSATATQSAKYGIARSAFCEPSIGSTTTVIGPRRWIPISSETIRTSGRSKCCSTTLLGGLVERGGDVAALALADRPLALLARRHRDEHGLHVGDRRAAQLEPGTQNRDGGAGRR